MAQILDRIKSDRMTSSKPEEDRRRRTIIIEKKNGSFGFTLQSYGIHYKKEQEIEMITYVDYVDYDGAAFRAGMREGDVILSINGHDMEKADHKTLVNFIKNCDSRMRMVVLFEDCVRKVELHMRYIQLQRVLQGKMVELERLCLRERELLQGKWKTHSLPARKKSSAVSPSTPMRLNDDCQYNYCRSTVSTEDVARVQQHAQSQVMFAYQCLDPGYYSLQRPPDAKSSEFLKSWSGEDASVNTPSQVQIDVGHSSKPCDQLPKQNSGKGYHQTNGMAAASSGSKSAKNKGHHQNVEQPHSTSNTLCSPCVQASQDNSSLEAYDLASPCCDPHCVPSARRRTRHTKDTNNVHSSRSSKSGTESRGWKDKLGKNPQSGQHVVSQSSGCQVSSHMPQPQNTRVHRYFSFGAGLVSQCSLHSCTSSELSCNVQGGVGCESSAASYTTSLSTDTLFWDPTTDGQVACRNYSSKPSTSKQCDMYQHSYHSNSHEGSSFSPYSSTKPAKSWDNLTTKAFGGYGFGYGYLDTSSVKSSGAKGCHGRTKNTKTNGNSRCEERIPGNSNTNPGFHNHHLYQTHCTHPNKSIESLLLLPKYSGDAVHSDSSQSCDCLDSTSPIADGNSSLTSFFGNQDVSNSCETYLSVHQLQQQQQPQQSQKQLQQQQQQQLQQQQLQQQQQQIQQLQQQQQSHQQSSVHQSPLQQQAQQNVRTVPCNQAQRNKASQTDSKSNDEKVAEITHL